MFISPELSLGDLLGGDYAEKAAAASRYYGLSDGSAASRRIGLYPERRQAEDDALLDDIGRRVIEPLESRLDGAPTDAYRRASNNRAAPLAGRGPTRVGEDGRLYLAAKSEHYHTPLGHSFPGYRLIDAARELGVPNATHNNTRGYITRMAEREIIREVNGLGTDEDEALDEIIAGGDQKTLNRIINLETGSLAVEAGVKMMLARFYRLDATYPAPKYEGRTPVFVVMADNSGGKEANYHGTTIFTQTMRGLWPEILQKMESGGLIKVVAAPINDAEAFARIIDEYNAGEYKTAGFLHEIVLMNYGGILLSEEFLKSAYDECARADTPVLVDEIQSCMWVDGMFLFKKYGLKPDFAVIGKGFPGGEYPASKIITTAEMDSLNQFGALVTNGQEELAALSYLVTMRFMRCNGRLVDGLGRMFMDMLRRTGERHPRLIARVEGYQHLAALHFEDVATAVEFAKRMTGSCVDVSAQTYKPNCPPAVLFKPPVICSERTLHFICDAVESALQGMEAGG